jgi:hypothetical protein
MKRIIKVFLRLTLMLIFISCTKDENIIEDEGIPTVIKGNVSDHAKGINVSGYKIGLVKYWYNCGGWAACAIDEEETYTAHTDSNGNYTISFNYKLKSGEFYAFKYYETQYQNESLSSSNNAIIAGITNIKNINVWKPIQLNINAQVLNNIHSPLHVRNEKVSNGQSFFNIETIVEQNITGTYSLRTRPDTDIEIIFWYYTGTNPTPVLHQKVFYYHTTLDDINTVNYTIDCSTF